MLRSRFVGGGATLPRRCLFFLLTVVMGVYGVAPLAMATATEEAGTSPATTPSSGATSPSSASSTNLTKPKAAATAPAPAPSKTDLLANSLPLRTALYHDPTLQAPLERLVAMFREQNRLNELAALYRTHIASYPNDAGATLVLIRVLQVSNGTEALSLARQAVTQFPKNADIRYILYALLRTGGDLNALAELETAIGLERTRPSKKRAWLEEIIPAAVKREDRAMAERNMLLLSDLVKDNVDAQLDAARLALSLKFYDQTLDILSAAVRNQPSAENGVEIEIVAAAAESGLNRPADAAKRLDALLGRVTADYWRRPEIIKQRMAMVRTEPEREALLRIARDAVTKSPNDEAAILSMAQLLEGFDRRREAERILMEAAERLPKSSAVESALMGVFDRLQNEQAREVFLAKRLAAQPGRSDLALRRLKSLYLLSRRAEARELLATTLAGMDPRTRSTTMLEIARFLRKSSMRQDAAALFEEMVKLEPARFELRRELAELYIAGDQKEQVRVLFSQPVPQTLAIEQFLEVLQFMVRQELWAQAREALTARARQDTVNIEVRVLLLQVLAQLGQQEEGLRVLTETRTIADSGARYRMWLDAATKFHDVFETTTAFLESERTKLEADTITDTLARSERMQAFLDVYGRSGIGKEQMEQTLRTRLAAADEPGLKIRLRERLVEILITQPGSYAAAEEQLTLLQKEDPTHRMDYLARLAVLHFRNQRVDQALRLLPGIDVQQVTQSSLVEGLLPIYKEDFSQYYGNGTPGAGSYSPSAGSTLALERLISMDPSNRAHWRQWLLQLASSGEEFKLRAGLQRVLAGVERMPLSDETRQELEGHLRDSYGRSAGKLAAESDQASWLEALPLLDFIYQGSADREQRAWALWMRAYLLKQLNQTAARDEAIVELEGLLAGNAEQIKSAGSTVAAKTTANPTGSSAPSANLAPLPELPMKGIYFPDGLTLSADAAMAMLRGPATVNGLSSNDSRANSRLTSDGHLVLAWCFDTPSGVPIQSVLQADEDIIFILDAQGTGYGINPRTGKLIWEQPGLVADLANLTTASQGPDQRSMQIVTRYQNGQRFVFRQQLRQPQGGQRSDRLGYVTPATDSRGLIYLPTTCGVLCISARTGQTVWENIMFLAPVAPSSNNGTGQELPPAPLTQVYCQDEKVWVAAPWRNEVAMFSSGSGKLLWTRKMEGGSEVAIPGASTGSSLGPKHFMSFGSATGLMDRQTGKPIWTLEPERVRRFPVDLKEPATTPRLESGRAQLNRFTTLREQYSGGLALGSRPGYNYTTDSQGQNVLYMDANPPGSSYIERMPGFQLSILAPAAVWASRTARATERMAVISATGRLLLLLPGEMLSINLEMPVGARRILAAGTFVGVAGRSAVFSQQNALVLVDTLNGEVTQVPYQQFIAAAANSTGLSPSTAAAGVWPQACVDGLLIYATGPWGIACVNARTAQVLHIQPWPQNLVGQGTINTISGSEGYQSRPYQSLTGVQIPNTSGQYAYLVPMVSSVQQGMLIASMSPSRVAAFVPPPAAALATPDGAYRAVTSQRLANEPIEKMVDTDSTPEHDSFGHPQTSSGEDVRRIPASATPADQFPVTDGEAGGQ